MDLAADFAVDARDQLEQLATRLAVLEATPTDRAALDAVFRAVHTLKGGAGFLALTPMVTLCHALEDALGAAREGRITLDAHAFADVQHAADVLDAMVDALARGLDVGEAPSALVEALRGLCASDDGGLDDFDFDALLDSLHGSGGVPGAADIAPVAPQAPAAPVAPAPVRSDPPAPADTTVRVEAARLDTLVDLVDELRLARSALRAVPACARDDALRAAAGTLDAVAARLQHAVLAARMQPVARVFARFPRIARDVARQLGKDVELLLDDGTVELDRALVDALAEPLVHLLRNAIDHGIEAPATRRAAGKPEAGRVQLRARTVGDACEITIEDDGAGIDAAALRANAVRKGLLEPGAAAALDDAAALQLVFAPGFSTREVVSDVSGRGVGMDAVREAIAALSGQVVLDSTPGTGTRCVLRLPLTLAVVPTLLVQCDGERYALPLAKVLQVRDRADDDAPRVDLRQWLGRTPAAPARTHVRVDTLGGDVQLAVDAVLGREDTVMRPLPACLRAVRGYTGTTTAADGRMALVLDVEALARD